MCWVGGNPKSLGRGNPRLGALLNVCSETHQPVARGRGEDEQEGEEVSDPSEDPAMKHQLKSLEEVRRGLLL